VRLLGARRGWEFHSVKMPNAWKQGDTLLLMGPEGYFAECRILDECVEAVLAKQSGQEIISVHTGSQRWPTKTDAGGLGKDAEITPCVPAIVTLKSTPSSLVKSTVVIWTWTFCWQVVGTVEVQRAWG
jgi:hypothetical protein